MPVYVQFNYYTNGTNPNQENMGGGSMKRATGHGLGKPKKKKHNPGKHGRY